MLFLFGDEEEDHPASVRGWNLHVKVPNGLKENHLVQLRSAMSSDS